MKQGTKGYGVDVLIQKSGTPAIADGNVSSKPGTLRKLILSWGGITTDGVLELKDGISGASMLKIVVNEMSIGGYTVIELNPNIYFATALFMSGISAIAGDITELTFIYEETQDTFSVDSNTASGSFK